jgi:hypothetical protein
MVLVIVGSIVGCYFLAVNILKTQQELANTVATSDLEKSKLQRLEGIYQSYQDVNADGYADKFNELLPGEPKFLDIVKSIEEVADKVEGDLVLSLGNARLTGQGIDVSGGAPGVINPNVAEKANGYAIIKVHGTLRVDYPGLIEFLRYINDTKFFLNVTTVGVRRVALADKPNKVDLSFTMSLYVDQLK